MTMNIKETELRLASLLTAYDRKQSTRRGYNRYAMGLMFQALSEARAMVETGKTWQQAINANFNDRLEALLLKAVTD